MDGVRTRRGVKQYFVRWQGFDDHQWIDEDDIHPDMIAAYEPPVKVKVARVGKSYVLEQRAKEQLPPDVRAQRLLDSSWWLDRIFSLIGTQLRRRKCAEAGALLCKLPCPDHGFVSINERLCALATSMDGDNLVSDIKILKGAHGGKHIKEEFKLRSFSLLRDLVGEHNSIESASLGAVVLRPNQTTYLIGPPVSFTFHANRTKPFLSYVTVRGHFVSLVNRRMPRGPRWEFDTEANYSDLQKHAYQISLAEGLVALEKNAPGQHAPGVQKLLKWSALTDLVSPS